MPREYASWRAKRGDVWTSVVARTCLTVSSCSAKVRRKNGRNPMSAARSASNSDAKSVWNGKALNRLCAAAICCIGVMLQMTTPGMKGHVPGWPVIVVLPALWKTPRNAEIRMRAITNVSAIFARLLSSRIGTRVPDIRTERKRGRSKNVFDNEV